MVNTISVKILCHVFQTLYPPLVAIFSHGLPIVGRETPILPVLGEIVGRGSRRAVHIEIVRSHPCFYAVAVNAYWYVTFQHKAVSTGLHTHFWKLYMQDILHK